MRMPESLRRESTSEEMNAIENFKKKFDYEKPDTGVAFYDRLRHAAHRL